METTSDGGDGLIFFTLCSNELLDELLCRLFGLATTAVGGESTCVRGSGGGEMIGGAEVGLRSVSGGGLFLSWRPCFFLVTCWVLDGESRDWSEGAVVKYGGNTSGSCNSTRLPIQGMNTEKHQSIYSILEVYKKEIYPFWESNFKTKAFWDVHIYHWVSGKKLCKQIKGWYKQTWYWWHMIVSASIVRNGRLWCVTLDSLIRSTNWCDRCHTTDWCTWCPTNLKLTCVWMMQESTWWTSNVTPWNI